MSNKTIKEIYFEELQKYCEECIDGDIVSCFIASIGILLVILLSCFVIYRVAFGIFIINYFYHDYLEYRKRISAPPRTDHLTMMMSKLMVDRRNISRNGTYSVFECQSYIHYCHIRDIAHYHFLALRCDLSQTEEKRKAEEAEWFGVFDEDYRSAIIERMHHKDELINKLDGLLELPAKYFIEICSNNNREFKVKNYVNFTFEYCSKMMNETEGELEIEELPEYFTSIDNESKLEFEQGSEVAIIMKKTKQVICGGAQNLNSPSIGKERNQQPESEVKRGILLLGCIPLPKLSIVGKKKNRKVFSI